MTVSYKHLGPFSDLVDAARASRVLFSSRGAADARRAAREVLAFSPGNEQPIAPRVERSWEADGIVGEEVSWSVGFGPRTHAWLLKPAQARASLPGVVALHDHGNFKLFGKERIADGPDKPSIAVSRYRSVYYGGRAFANHLARRGFAVLVHDCFLWGSRRFPLETIPATERVLADAAATALDLDRDDPEAALYNGAAYLHESLVEKYCTVLGTSLAAIVAYEDRVGLGYLRRRDDVDATRCATIGFSGGGLRAALLGAMTDIPLPRVIVGMMSTYESLLDKCVAAHTWMLFPPGWSVHGDLPDLAAAGAPGPLVVQYALDDALFTPEGMRTADAKITAAYAAAGAPDEYRGEFYDGPHRFDGPMQEAAFDSLERLV